MSGPIGWNPNELSPVALSLAALQAICSAILIWAALAEKKGVQAAALITFFVLAAASMAFAGEITVQPSDPGNPGFQFHIRIDGEPMLQPILPGQPFVVEDGESATITIVPTVPDAGADGRIGLEDAIHALRVVSGGPSDRRETERANQ